MGEDTTSVDTVAVAHLQDSRKHLLRDHLDGVAALAEQFADAFGSGDWAGVCGLLHDLGKYSPAFQTMIRAGQGPGAVAHAGGAKVDHSTSGAVLAMQLS